MTHAHIHLHILIHRLAFVTWPKRNTFGICLFVIWLVEECLRNSRGKRKSDSKLHLLIPMWQLWRERNGDGRTGAETVQDWACPLVHLSKSDNVLMGSGMEGLLLWNLVDYTLGRSTGIFMESSCVESWGQINLGNFALARAEKTKTFRIDSVIGILRSWHEREGRQRSSCVCFCSSPAAIAGSGLLL